MRRFATRLQRIGPTFAAGFKNLDYEKGAWASAVLWGWAALCGFGLWIDCCGRVGVKLGVVGVGDCAVAQGSDACGGGAGDSGGAVYLALRFAGVQD